MKRVKTWKEKNIALDDDIQDLIDYHQDNFSLSIIKDRFNEEINSRRNQS